MVEKVLHIPLQQIYLLSSAVICRLFPMACQMCQTVHILSQRRHQRQVSEGTSDDEVLMDDDEASSKRPYMPFDLCELSEHDSNAEAPSGARGQRVEPEVHSGPSRDPEAMAKRARVDLSIKDAQRSLSNESIAKFLAHECDCGKDCTSFITRKGTLRWCAATYDFCRHGRVADHALRVLDAVKIANPNTRKDLKMNSNVFVHKLDELCVCEDVFRLAHVLIKTALKHGRQASLNNLGSVPKRSRTGRAIPDHDTDKTEGTEQEQQTLVWMKDWVEHHGCKQPDSEIVYIDDIDVPMDDMWRENNEEI